jgi:hypothetical protein
MDDGDLERGTVVIRRSFHKRLGKGNSRLDDLAGDRQPG